MYPLIGYKIRFIKPEDLSEKITLYIYTDSILKFQDSAGFSEIVEYNWKNIDENIYLVYWKSEIKNMIYYQIHNFQENFIVSSSIYINTTIFSQEIYILETSLMEKYYCGSNTEQVNFQNLNSYIN